MSGSADQVERQGYDPHPLEPPEVKQLWSRRLAPDRDEAFRVFEQFALNEDEHDGRQEDYH
jgi:hypothetical protein